MGMVSPSVSGPLGPMGEEGLLGCVCSQVAARPFASDLATALKISEVGPDE